MEEWGEVLTSGDRGDQELTSIKGALTSVEDIWLGLISVEIYCGARADICGGWRGLLAQDRFQLTDIWSGSMSFWDFGVRINVRWEHRCPQSESHGGHAFWKDRAT